MLCYRKPGLEDYYLYSFLSGVSLRENCYSCQFARPERVSDITIGDFIGLGKRIPFKYSIANVSSVTTNTEKGSSFYEEVVANMPELVSIERDYAERLEYKPSLVEPFDRHPLNSQLREYYPQFGFVESIRIVLRKRILWNKIKRVLNYWTYIYRVPRKIVKIVLNLTKR